MPEYSYPGVYVVEVDSAVRPTEGVSTSTAQLIGRDSLDRLRRLAGPLPPDWTSGNDHDPGIALLELLAYVTEVLSARADLVTDEAMLHSSRLAAASLRLARNARLPRGSALKAVSFYQGRLRREEGRGREKDKSDHCLWIAKAKAAS